MWQTIWAGEVVSCPGTMCLFLSRGNHLPGCTAPARDSREWVGTGVRESTSPLSLAWCCLRSLSPLLCTEKAGEPEADRELTAALGVTKDLLFCALGLWGGEDEASAPEASPGLSWSKLVWRQHEQPLRAMARLHPEYCLPLAYSHRDSTTRHWFFLFSWRRGVCLTHVSCCPDMSMKSLVKAESRGRVINHRIHF